MNQILFFDLRKALIYNENDVKPNINLLSFIDCDLGGYYLVYHLKVFFRFEPSNYVCLVLAVANFLIYCVKYHPDCMFDSTRYEYQILHIGFDGFDDLDDDEENEDPDTTSDPINEVDVKVCSISFSLDREMVKYTQTIRMLLTNCLSVFENFVGLALIEIANLTSILQRCTFLGVHKICLFRQKLGYVRYYVAIMKEQEI